MKTYKNAMSLLLCLIILCTLCAFSSLSARATGEDSLISGTFVGQTLDGTDPGELEYYYSDDYFRTSGKELNLHLQTMSGVLMFTTRGVSENPDETCGRVLREIGFGDVVTYDMDHITMETIGIVLAHKEIDGKDVVAVVIRGDDYGVEMAANFLAGASGDIEAFASAEALVESRVDAYLETYGITTAKYWVVGYSRSGAVANLFGRELNRNLTRFCTAEDDIYVYTIEAALSSGDDTACENIHNVIDLRDAVTYVYPAVWSLYNSGIPSYIGSADETIIIYRYDSSSATYMTELSEVNSADFLQEFFDFLGTNVSRAVYCEKLQIPISSVLEIFFGLSKDCQQELLTYFQRVGDEIMQDPNLFSMILSAVINPTSNRTVNKTTEFITKYMDKVSEEYGQPLDDDSCATLKAAIRPAVEVMLPVFSKDYKAKYDSGDGAEPVSATLYHLMTFFGNLETLFRHHFNYNIFSELTALDSYYVKRPDRIRGDADGNGEVNILDATRVQRWLAGFTVDSFNEEVADADGSGMVTILDATAIQRYLACLATYEGIGKKL